MVRNNISNIKAREGSRRGVAGRETLHSDMTMDVSPSSTTGGNTTEHRRPQHHEDTGTGGVHEASSAVPTAGAGTAGMSPPSAMGINAAKAIVLNNNDEYQPARKRHHSSSSPAASNQKVSSASAAVAAVARTSIRNSSVHSSTSSSGSGGENGNTSKTTTTGASVKFAMPPKVVAGGSATGSSLSLSSYEDCNSKKISALKQKQHQQQAAGAGTKDDGTNNNKSPPPHTSASNNDSSRSKSSSGSGSGSDGNEGGATSSSNPAVVTQSTYNTTSGSGGGDTRSTSGSGSGSDGGMGGNNRRNGGETSASNEYYFAGYGSGSLAGRASSSGNSGQGGPTGVASAQVPPAGDAAGVAVPLPAMGGMASFASFRGATLAAAANAAAAMPPGANNNNMSTSRHVVVATDDARGLPPPPQAQSHLRHHLRHHHHHHRNDLQAPPLPQGGVAAATRPVMPPARSLDGIPSSIGGPHQALPQPQPHQQYELRLPPSDEQAVLQRVPQAHATVVAHDLPPPPTSSDAWSSTSGSGSSSKPRKLNVASAGVEAMGQPISVASAGMADGKTMGTLNENNRTSPSSSVTSGNAAKPQAMHVSTDDPILRKKMSLKDEGTPAINKAGSTSHKRKAGALTRESSDDSSDGVKSESEERSGSDGGYEASSSSNENRPSSGSGSDSVSSEDAKKVATARNPPSNPSEVRMESQSNSKRTETSSMSSSVLADFSSVLNEETHALHSGSTSPRSTSSSLTSIGNEAQAKTMLSPAVGAVNINEKPAAVAAKASSASVGSKRDASHLKTHTDDKRSKPSSPVSFELPSATNLTMKSGLAIIEKTLQSKVRSAHHHHYHSRRSVGRKMLQESYLSAQRDLSESPPGVKSKDEVMKVVDNTLFEEATIYSLGHDAMANIASFLHPQETHSFLTTPFSKTWLQTYTAPQELWKILCTSKPFYAMLPSGSESGDDGSTSSYPLCNDLQMRHLFGRYRLLYASFVRCMKYLNRLQDDALNGREPSMTSKSNPSDIYPFNNNVSLKAYFEKARRIVRSRRNRNDGVGSEVESQESLTSESSNEKKRKRQSNGGSGPRLGNSMITNRLLRPTAAGEVDNVNLPWSCAIYSVVNWMVAFQDVEGIQIMCLKTLPYLLEDEQQRTTAQRAGLTDNVLRAMVLFPDSIELHTVAFHTLVLLARPLGGNEGMLFHSAMVNTRGIFNNGSTDSKNGIVIMLDSMRRFAQDEILQAMSCWSLVNVALTPLQKSILVKLGGLTVTANAMLQHPYNAEVQFRALFALINLVIPSK